jgi:hypothetical protein
MSTVFDRVSGSSGAVAQGQSRKSHDPQSGCDGRPSRFSLICPAPVFEITPTSPLARRSHPTAGGDFTVTFEASSSPDMEIQAIWQRSPRRDIGVQIPSLSLCFNALSLLLSVAGESAYQHSGNARWTSRRQSHRRSKEAAGRPLLQGPESRPALIRVWGTDQRHDQAMTRATRFAAGRAPSRVSVPSARATAPAGVWAADCNGRH